MSTYDLKIITNAISLLIADTSVKLWFQISFNDLSVLILKSTYLWFQIGKYLRMVYNFSIEMELFRNMGKPWALFRLFLVFSNNFYNKFMWKNVHPVYGAGIRTHNLRNVSLFPLLLDQDSRPTPPFNLCPVCVPVVAFDIKSKFQVRFRRW